MHRLPEWLQSTSVDQIQGHVSMAYLKWEILVACLLFLFPHNSAWDIWYFWKPWQIELKSKWKVCGFKQSLSLLQEFLMIASLKKEKNTLLAWGDEELPHEAGKGNFICIAHFARRENIHRQHRPSLQEALTNHTIKKERRLLYNSTVHVILLRTSR